MKQIFLVSAALLIAVFLMPFAAMPDMPLLSADAVEPPSPPVTEEEAIDEEPMPAAETAAESEQESAALSFDENTYVTVSISGSETSITLKDYLRGVMAGEVPASFPEEALKAQAVAARTYIMHEPQAVFCDDPGHCMAYSTEYDPRLDRAVEDTDGQIIVYEDEPILAVFFSTSSGKTENAADVWGGDYPYLTAVESAGEEDAPRYKGTVTVSTDEFWSELKDITPSDTPFGNIERSSSGGVVSIMINGTEVSGQEIREKFGIISTNFTTAIVDGSIVFETVGYGHGVGMPQYGASAMALAGAGYEEILTHYYKGVSIRLIEAQDIA